MDIFMSFKVIEGKKTVIHDRLCAQIQITQAKPKHMATQATLIKRFKPICVHGITTAWLQI